ncbi:MAG: membrane protein, putative [Candidatus Woesebacteria bacterium]|jgi:hypothetical protein|nr:MAG: membrane protein, putative [Candidatus Woesebacteria bacterium]
MGKFLKKYFSLIPAIYLAIIYLKTLLPDVGFWDTGEFQTIGYTFDISHPTGYPLYIILLKIFTSFLPIGNIAYRANLLSALLSIFAIYFVSKTIFIITKNIALSLFVPIILGTNPFLWSTSTRADPHTLHFFFVSLFIYIQSLIIIKKKHKMLYLLSLVFGLSLTNHLLSIFILPTFILTLLLIKIPLKKKVITNALVFIPLLIYLIIPTIYHFKGAYTIDYNLKNPHNFVRYILGQDFSPQSSFKISKDLFVNLANGVKLLEKNMGRFLFLTSIFGLVVFVIKEKLALALPPLFLLNLFFSANYQNAVIERYFLTNLLLLFLSTAYLLNIFLRNLELIIRNKTGKFKFTNLGLNFLIALLLIAPIRDNILKNYKNINQSKNYHARNWATSTLNSLEPNAVIFSWWSYSTPLWYLQKVEKTRPDVLVINDGQNNWEEKAKYYLGKRPVYFIEKIKLKDENLTLINKGSVFKLEEN